MSAQKNVDFVKRVYGAIGQADIPAVIGMMAEDVEVHLPGPPEIPFAGTFRGHAGVGQFFQAIGANADIQHFEPREFIAEGDKVVVLGREHLVAKPTDRSWETDWAMVWTIRDGRVESLREFHETGSIAAAFRSNGGAS